MKRLILVLLVISAALFPPILRSKAIYEIPAKAMATNFPAPMASQASSSPSLATVTTFVESEALKRGINPKLADCLVSAESQWQSSRIGDVGNLHGESYGLWQIEVQQHPDITIAEALDYQYATDWALSKIAAGDVGWWSTYREYCSAKL